MEVKQIPANKVQSVTMPVDFYADLVVKARTLELLERAVLENIREDYHHMPCITDHFTDAVKAIIPDTYDKMVEKLAEENAEEE